MIRLIATALFLVFSVIWYLPVSKKQLPDDRLSAKTFWKALLLGMFPAFFLAILFQSAFGWGIIALGVERGSFNFDIWMSIIGYAVAEELSKLLFAGMVLKKEENRSRAHTVLVFGAVGLGFGILESMMFITDIASALLRGVFCLHVFLQFWMGYYYSKNRWIAVIVPIMVHMLHDVVGAIAKGFMNGILPVSGSLDGQTLGGLLFVATGMVDLVFVIITLVKVHRMNKLDNVDAQQ